MEKKNQKNQKLDKKGLISSNSNSKKKNNNDLELYNYDDFNYISEKTNLSKFNNDYRKKLDERMDLLMEQIDKKINNNKYSDLNTIITNYKTNSFNSLNNINNNNINNNNNNEKKFNKEKEKDNIQEIDDDININKNIVNQDNKIREKNEEENNEYDEYEEEDDEEIKNGMNRTGAFPTRVQIVCKRENEINNKLLKRSKYLENELNYLKFKLDKVEKQKNFLQNVIMNNKNINKSIFDIFLVNYFKNIAMNWKEVSDEIIDELLIDEIHELTKVKLQLRNAKREEEKKMITDNESIRNENNYISPYEVEEFILFNDNLKGIKQVIRSVKESERNLCKKYKIKIK